MLIHFDVLIESTRCVAIEGLHQDGTADFLSCNVVGHDMRRIAPHLTRKDAIDRAISLAVELLGDIAAPSVRDYIARR